MPTLYTTGKRIDHYQIMRPLGRGGASHVYPAQDWHALQEVVLKFPNDALIGGAAVFERYKREAEIGGRYRQAIHLALIVLIVCLCIVAFGVLAQYAHHHFR